jgi:hypothetical protein
MIEVIMPKWGLTMESGTMGPWRKQEGDAVAEGEVIAEVATEKSPTSWSHPPPAPWRGSWSPREPKKYRWVRCYA